jgi:hypothetical protein
LEDEKKEQPGKTPRLPKWSKKGGVHLPLNAGPRWERHGFRSYRLAVDKSLLKKDRNKDGNSKEVSRG